MFVKSSIFWLQFLKSEYLEFTFIYWGELPGFGAGRGKLIFTISGIVQVVDKKKPKTQ